jgi:16S rRNA (cytosine1402-N4)-methyltransferase
VPLDQHRPVLFAETLDALAPSPGARLIDCTVNGGGHSAGILERTEPDGQLLALDADPRACEVARTRFRQYGDRVRVVHSNYRHVGRVASDAGFVNVNGVLMDLGFSSRQIAAPERGFSFLNPGPLDMRYDQHSGVSAAQYLASASREDIEGTLRALGEEPRARSIAAAIVARRERDPIQTTADLADTVAAAVGGRQGRLHPATRTFQALRILVNDELGALQDALPQCVELLRRGGRLVVISFHSLEDRIVKAFMRRQAGAVAPDQPRNLPVVPVAPAPTLRLIGRRPIRPTAAEVAANPRSRSARLRVAERV